MLKRMTTEKAREKVLQRARDYDRPVLTGLVAVDLQLSLAEAESLMKDMVNDGVLRRASQKELDAYDLRDGYRPV